MSGITCVRTRVLAKGTGRLEDVLRELLDLLLGVVDRAGKDGDNGGGLEGHLGRSRGDELLDNLKGTELGGVLAARNNSLEESGEDDGGTGGVHGLGNGLGGGDGSLTGTLLLVTEGGKEGGEEAVGGSRDDVGLELLAGTVLDEDRDRSGSGLTGGDVLLGLESLEFVSK